MKIVDNLINYLHRRLTEYKDRSAPIRTEQYRGQRYIPRSDEPYADMSAERQDAVIAIAVHRVANALSQLPLMVMSVDIEGGEFVYDRDDKHPFTAIIDEPNPDNTYSEIITHIVQSLFLTGTSYLNTELIGGEVAEIWPLEPHRMTIETTEAGRKTGFRYARGTSSVTYRTDEIIHHRLYNINDLIYGGSLIEPIHPEVLERRYINRYQKSFFKNGAHMDRMFSPANPMTPEQIESMVISIKAEHGGPDNAYKTFIAPVAGELKNLSQNNDDLGFEILLKNSRELILAMLGVPPFLGGVMEYANYANALVQEKTFWRHTMLPLAKLIEDSINKQCLWRHYDPDHVVKFDTSQVQALQEDAREAAETDSILIAAGIQTVDEIRAKRGLDPLPEAEAPAVPKPVEETEEDETEEVQLDPRLLRAKNRLSRNLLRYAREITQVQDTQNNNGHKEGDYEEIILGCQRYTVPRQHRIMEVPEWRLLLKSQGGEYDAD